MEQEHKRLIDKSIEAFIMGLEVYNKPTIRYRVEGFSFFIVNAWELLLKSEMIKRGMSIYYKNNQDRTVSVDVAVRKIYPDEHTRIRLNLEKIIELRNISTHYITEDYEQKYVPLFQACVLNYANELMRFEHIDISERIAPNFLTLTTKYEPLTNEQIRRIDYEKGFNKYVLKLVMDFYDVKSEPKFAYKHEFGKNERYTYSQQFVDFVFDEIKKNPDKFVESLRQEKR